MMVMNGVGDFFIAQLEAFNGRKNCYYTKRCQYIDYDKIP
jgi:hypothetical protein